jgi:hypothetical protein
VKKIPELAISSEKVAAILAKARRFDVKDAVTDPDSSSNGRVFTQSSSIDGSGRPSDSMRSMD